MSFRTSTSRLAFALALVVLAAGCSKNSSPTAPTAVDPRFVATLLPANEVPAVSNADSTGSGTVLITMHLTKDSAGNITAATADFVVTLTGFPTPTTLTGAHIHSANFGVNGSIIWSTTIANGEIVLPNGSVSFTKTATLPNDVAIAQAIINNPAGFYFNVHSTINTGGCARGQLARAN